MSNTLGFGLDVNRGGGGGFNPKKISGLALWLDASDLTTITKDGSNYVSAWADKSGNGRNVTQATGSAQPSWQDALQNSKAGIIFGTGAAKYLDLASALSLTGGNYTITIVRKATSLTPSVCYFLAGVGQGLHAGGSSGGVDGYASFDGVNAVQANEEPVTCNVFTHVPTKLYKDNIEATLALTGNVATLSLSRLGARADNAAFYYVGNIHEITIHTKILTDAERGKLQNYLKNKWGTP